MSKRLGIMLLKYIIAPVLMGLFLFAAPLLMLWGLSWMGLDIDWSSWKVYVGVLIVWGAVILSSFYGAQIAQADLAEAVAKLKP